MYIPASLQSILSTSSVWLTHQASVSSCPKSSLGPTACWNYSNQPILVCLPCSAFPTEIPRKAAAPGLPLTPSCLRSSTGASAVPNLLFRGKLWVILNFSFNGTVVAQSHLLIKIQTQITTTVRVIICCPISEFISVNFTFHILMESYSVWPFISGVLHLA